MTDGTLLLLWIVVLACGLGSVVALHGLGLRATYARDLLHVGTGIWVLGWPSWSQPILPGALVVGAAAMTALVPLTSRRLVLAARFQQSVSEGDERYHGLVLYTLAYAGFTWIGLTREPFPAAAALLALSLGDGLGGAVGRRVGRTFYSAPGGKRKSLEGSAVVAVMAAAGAALAAMWFHTPVDPWLIVALGVIAALAEALSPRGSDNAVVPTAVWLGAVLLM